MQITNLLNKLPDWRSWWSTRLLRTKYAATQVESDVSAIVKRVMGDVLDWLRLTPNAVVL